MAQPLIICITPVRNEAWILNAFLKATSLWADFIIVADQMSTDDSRKIALKYSKVILIDNQLKEMNQFQTRKLLLDEVDKIEGDKILFSLDADEFLSGDFVNTLGWQKIIRSKPGEVFYFKWINLIHSVYEHLPHDKWMLWACHYDDNIRQGHFPESFIHEWRIPYPKKNAKETRIKDIQFIHFARVNKLRQMNKNIYYQVITKYKEPEHSLISLHRSYNPKLKEGPSKIDEAIYSFYVENGLDFQKEINLNDIGQHYVNQYLHYLDDNGLEYFAGLDIWYEKYIKENGLRDPRSLRFKLLHAYLNKTKNIRENSFLVRFLDAFLKKMGL
jgi:hypothetical protein